MTEDPRERGRKITSIMVHAIMNGDPVAVPVAEFELAAQLQLADRIKFVLGMAEGITEGQTHEPVHDTGDPGVPEADEPRA